MQEESSTIRLHNENMSPGASWCSISYSGKLKKGPHNDFFAMVEGVVGPVQGCVTVQIDKHFWSRLLSFATFTEKLRQIAWARKRLRDYHQLDDSS